MTLKSHLWWFSPSSGLFLSSLTALGCGSSLGSGSRMQTRQFRCLGLNPKRKPLGGFHHQGHWSSTVGRAVVLEDGGA